MGLRVLTDKQPTDAVAFLPRLLRFERSAYEGKEISDAN